MKKWYIAGAALLALVCLLGLAVLFLPGEGRATDAEKQIQAEVQAAWEASGRPDAAGTAARGDVDALYQSPIDFAALRELSPDIYAWLYVVNTPMNYPILQHPTDDEYYLRRSSTGGHDNAGCIFSQAAYNSTDFNDPATVLYGHNLRSGGMFHPLLEIYSYADGLKEYPEIVVFLPEGERHYTVFAAVPYSPFHLLYNLDFSDPGIYTAFLESVRNVRAMEAQYNSEVEVTPDDRLLILSTCLDNNSSKRYLVLAKEET